MNWTTIVFQISGKRISVDGERHQIQDSRTCYPRRAFNQKTTDGSLIPVGSMVNRELDRELKNERNRITVINDFLTVTSLEKIPWEGESLTKVSTSVFCSLVSSFLFSFQLQESMKNHTSWILTFINL
jgi:hypothetical protein